MVLLQRQLPGSRSCGLILAIILLAFLSPSTVQADVGIQPILPGGSSIKPGEETPIQMAAEILTINVRQATEADNAVVKLNSKYYGYDFLTVWFKGIAEVEADFMMKNPTSDPVSLTVWFPLASALEKAYWSGNRPGEIVPRLESFQVSANGKLIEYAVSELPNPKGVDSPPLPWASFPVTFPGETDTTIHVTYMVPLQSSVKGYELALYYIFQTGAGWAGPIGQAELILNLPYPASAGTLAAMNQNLSLPPLYLPKPAGLPSGVVLDGNQARWTWKEFEPGPEDDFAVWLLQPEKWQELEAARAAVQANPRDGQAWLNLAYIYHSLSLTWTNVRLLFSPAYLQPCIKAYKKAADLLPEHPVPHAALGLFTLEPYLSGQNAPANVIEYAQSELQTAKELETENPALTEGALITSEDLANALFDYFYNDATATADAATRAGYSITETARATIDYATRTVMAFAKSTNMILWATNMNCWATAGADCTATPNPTATGIPKPTLFSTPRPSATPTPVPPIKESAGKETIQVVIGGGIVFGLLIGGYLASKLPPPGSNDKVRKK